MSKAYEWKQQNRGWDALDGYKVVAHVYTSQSKDLGLIYIAYAYSNPDDKVGSMTLEQAKIAAINLHEYPAEVEAETPSPGTINRLDPAWAMFACVAAQGRTGGFGATYPEEYQYVPVEVFAADFADAMIRERDRRDREERP